MTNTTIAVVRCQNGNYTAINVTNPPAAALLADELSAAAKREPLFETPEACALAASQWYPGTFIYDETLTDEYRAQLGYAGNDFALYSTMPAPSLCEDACAGERGHVEACPTAARIEAEDAGADRFAG